MKKILIFVCAFSAGVTNVFTSTKIVTLNKELELLPISKITPQQSVSYRHFWWDIANTYSVTITFDLSLKERRNPKATFKATSKGGGFLTEDIKLDAKTERDFLSRLSSLRIFELSSEGVDYPSIEERVSRIPFRRTESNAMYFERLSLLGGHENYKKLYRVGLDEDDVCAIASKLFKKLASSYKNPNEEE